MLRSLATLVLVCGLLEEATCLVKNIKTQVGHQSNANATIFIRDLFAKRQSCDPGYGLCDSGSCCSLSDQCCGYGCAPGDAVCCGVEGNCDAGSTCCDYNCAPSGWGCCDTGYAAPLDADCCGDGGYCPSGTYCVDCDDGTEGCCNSPYSVSSYDQGASSPYVVPEPSSTVPFSDPGSTSSSYAGGVDHYQYYYTVYTYWYIVWYLTTTTTTTTLTSSTTTTSTRLKVYASNSRDAQNQFSSLENYVQSIASTPVTLSSAGFAAGTASSSKGGSGPGPNARAMFARGDIIGLWMVLFAGFTGLLAVAL